MAPPVENKKPPRRAQHILRYASCKDVAMYAALLSRIGLVPLAVTTNLNINFLRKPVAHAAIRARAKLLKVGRTMGVGEVFVYSEGMEEPVAHATLTYSIPPEKYR